MPKRPTIVDVAKLAGVSKATVARVVNGQHDIVSQETQKRVVDAIDKLGYERNSIAGSLRTDKTFMIALSIPDITNPFWPEVTRGVQDTLETSEYAVVTVNSDWDAARELKYLRMVRRNRFDGLIINPTDASSTYFRDMEVPIVLLGSGNGYAGYDSVGSDTESAVQIALDYLYSLGHRRIALIAGLSARRKNTSRYHSYVAFLARNQLKLDPELVVHGDFSLQAGQDAMRQLLSLPHPPSAVFAANDIIAIGAMQTAAAMNWRIPEQISIIGMDDIYMASTSLPPLTTIAKPKYEIGVEAARLLLARLEYGDDLPIRAVRLPCELVVRGSTAPPAEMTSRL
ncbi:MAG: LacI family transcriptional regulator [Anaerolineae bacterium]|nr:LacI family transcriptional regulator [Anaerolineae bacterium]NUQ03695.1 LacI family DNA-binding transcriptional regulator [Anaerolineae bacterium]